MQNHFPKITVFMSVYNGQSYLREAIESILTQTFTDFEFLIIDDGSDDGSCEILEEYAQQDVRIRLVQNHQNIGLTKSLNKGIDIARGKYIARMDADDVSLPERLERQYNFMEDQPDVGVCGTWAQLINEDGTIIGNVQMPLDHNEILFACLFDNHVIHPSVVFRKNEILNLGKYDEKFERTQDFDLWQRCFVTGIKIENLPEYLIKLRKHKDIVSMTQRDKQEVYARIVLQNMYKTVINKDVGPKTIALLREFLLKGLDSFNIINVFKLYHLFRSVSKRATLVLQDDSITLEVINRRLDELKQRIHQNILFKLIIFNRTPKKVLKKIVLKIPYLRRIVIRYDAVVAERDAVVAERENVFNELAYNYIHEVLRIYKHNYVAELLPIVHKFQEMFNRKKNKILFVAMPHSIHTARWIAQLDELEWDIHLFPSMVMRGMVHQLMTNITIHCPFTKDLGTEEYTEEFYAYKLAKVIDDLQPDIVHSLEMQHAGYLTFLAKQKAKMPFPTWIYSCWGSDIFFFQHFDYHKKCIEETLSQCDFLFTDTRRDVKLAKKFGFHGKLLGVFPGPGGFKIDEMRTICPIINPSERKHIVLKGYTHWVYRPFIILKALEQCLEEIQGYKLIVYLPGSHEFVQEVEKTCSKLNIPFELFQYTMKHNEVIKLFASARVTLASSISDGTPNSMLESMTMGAFPIQSDTVSTSEWIQSGNNGILVEPEDIDGFASAIKKALIDNEMVDRAAEFNLNILKERIDYSIVQPQVIEAYKKVFKYHVHNTTNDYI